MYEYISGTVAEATPAEEKGGAAEASADSADSGEQDAENKDES